MRILFTRSSSLMSRLIRHVTGEPVSHCAIEAAGHVVHANLLGVHAEPYERFADKCEIWAGVAIKDDYEGLLAVFCKRSGSWYDFGAMSYLGLRCIFPWLPKKNLWQTSGMFLCTEWVTEAIEGSADSMITPYKLFKRLTRVKETTPGVPSSLGVR